MKIRYGSAFVFFVMALLIGGRSFGGVQNVPETGAALFLGKTNEILYLRNTYNGTNYVAGLRFSAESNQVYFIKTP